MDSWPSPCAAGARPEAVVAPGRRAGAAAVRSLVHRRRAIAEAVKDLGSPGDWRMLTVAANGQPTAAAYHRQPDGSYRAYGIVVLTATVTGIARRVVFADPGLFGWFGLP